MPFNALMMPLSTLVVSPCSDILRTDLSHSHTFENKSSLPPNPDPPAPPVPLAGLAGAIVADGVIVATGAVELLQPPKSSSALTFGGLDVPNPPLAPSPPLLFALLPPHPNSLALVDAVVAVCVVASGLAAVASDEFHTSFEPQASELAQPEPVPAAAVLLFEVCTLVLLGAVGVDRLKTELCCCGGDETAGFAGSAWDEEGKSKRSPRLELGPGGTAEIMDENEESINVLEVWLAGAGWLLFAGAGVGSKKPPPTDGAAGVDF